MKITKQVTRGLYHTFVSFIGPPAFGKEIWDYGFGLEQFFSVKCRITQAQYEILYVFNRLNVNIDKLKQIVVFEREEKLAKRIYKSRHEDAFRKSAFRSKRDFGKK